MAEDWLNRWEEGRTGWHEPSGNVALKTHWPPLSRGSRVLVPLCGKSVDLLWLADRGLEVTGVELSALAIEAFFAEQGLEFNRHPGVLDRYIARHRPISIVCGDFFEFTGELFDAVFDRGALVAMPRDVRPEYAAHSDALLRPRALRFIVTLEYEQSRVAGPPFAVWPKELLGYWPELQRIAEHDDIGNCPPKFRDAGLEYVTEAAWCTPLPAAGG
jgi:thiopurine S-methyltransferase